jgi:septal ring factor EnvC (AmiA/AmiB activator)
VRSNGIEIKAPYGTAVKAVAQGKVVYAERFLGYGKVILIDHGGGFYSLYGHLADYLVSLGAAVKELQSIGTVGDTGSLEGPRLYFELRQNGKPVDPLGWLSKR